MVLFCLVNCFRYFSLFLFGILRWVVYARLLQTCYYLVVSMPSCLYLPCVGTIGLCRPGQVWIWTKPSIMLTFWNLQIFISIILQMTGKMWRGRMTDKINPVLWGWIPAPQLLVVRHTLWGCDCTTRFTEWKSFKCFSPRQDERTQLWVWMAHVDPTFELNLCCLGISVSLWYYLLVYITISCPRTKRLTFPASLSSSLRSFLCPIWGPLSNPSILSSKGLLSQQVR